MSSSAADQRPPATAIEPGYYLSGVKIAPFPPPKIVLAPGPSVAVGSVPLIWMTAL